MNRKGITTGCLDYQHEEIYEGDIIEPLFGEEKRRLTVGYDYEDDKFVVDGGISLYELETSYYRVVGSIYDDNEYMPYSYE